MKTTILSGAAMAAAAASLFAAGVATTTTADAAPKMGHCMAANSCKGLSACTGGRPGLNACKGQGFAMTAAAPCKRSGHKFESM